MHLKTKKATSLYLNHGEEDEMEISGYKRSILKTILTWISIILTIGLLRLVFHWWPHLLLYSTHQPCSLDKASTILVLEKYGSHNYKRYHVKRIKTLCPSNEGETISILGEDGTLKEYASFRYFFCKKLRYIWDNKLESFRKVQGLEKAPSEYLHGLKGLSSSDQNKRLEIFGSNEIKVEVASIGKLIFLETLNPFYVFQVFSIALWLSDYYYYYAGAIIIMSLVGIASTVYQTRQNQSRLRRTVQSSDIIEVLRGNGLYEMIPTEKLVPGDVVVIPAQGLEMNCDVVLLSGNCIVNESMLTGESVPVTKTPMPECNVIYNLKEHGRHTLFCGTKVIQTRYYGQEKVLAAVIRTGFMTTKGLLVRSIMYPPPVDYKFEKDSYKFVGFMAGIASIGFLASVWWKVRNEEALRSIIVQSLDLITIIIPPALPAAMTVGRIYALKRLEIQGIFCTSPRTITVTGSIDCVCFDKTGTLTEEGLDLRAVIPLSNSQFKQPVSENSLGGTCLEVGMATCHSLTKISDEIVGDPLDLKMFEWTKWTFEEPQMADNEKFDNIIPAIVRSPSNGLTEVGIMRQFPFNSHLQRMAVITRSLHEEHFELYCKGSPEKIISLCSRESVPQDFSTILASYTKQGYRVIALAHKRLTSIPYTKVQRLRREEIEQDLTLLGLIVLENRLKPESALEIRVLKDAGIRTIMVTGDNLQTSTSVGIECGMVTPADQIYILDTEETIANNEARPKLTLQELVPNQPGQIETSLDHKSLSIDKKYHLAITGKCFEEITSFHPHLIQTILTHGTIFARMSPDQKQQLVEGLQACGYFVGMCGDGANDCGALKAAHAGVSLSDAEASVASPFTYNKNNISCVSSLIREGRTALVTSFGIFKYMVIYSFTQFLSMCILYTASTNLSDGEFLYIDLFLISLFALFFGHTEPGPTLVPTSPPFSLISFHPMLSIILQTISIFIFQILGLIYVQRQPWFIPKEYSGDDQEVQSYENFSVFGVSVFQYIVMVVVYAQGKPYRKPIWTNYRLIGSVVILTAFTLYLILEPCSWLVETFKFLMPPKLSFRAGLVGIAVGHCLTAFFIEQVIVNYFGGKFISRGTEKVKRERKKDVLKEQDDKSFFAQFNNNT